MPLWKANPSEPEALLAQRGSSELVALEEGSVFDRRCLLFTSIPDCLDHGMATVSKQQQRAERAFGEGTFRRKLRVERT
jgi:hypothetical protein